ncbi:hypothetical protein LCGC14_2952180, partial [marine sediment metagenome]
TDSSKKFIEDVSLLTGHRDHPKWQTLAKRLAQWNVTMGQWTPSRPLIHFASPEKMASWLNTHSHLTFANLTYTIEKIRPLLQEEAVEAHKRAATLDSALRDLNRAERLHNPTVAIRYNKVDWEKVTSGKQKAPQFLDLTKAGFSWLEGNEWIYVLPGMPAGDYRYNHSKESSPDSPEVGITREEAIVRTNKDYLALYRPIGQGIAEWVYTKEPKDETPNPISVAAVDWDEVDKGDQEAPRLLNLNIQDPPQRLATLKANEWIYVGVGTEDTAGIYHTGWDPSGSVSLKQALSRIKKGVPFYLGFSDIYRYVGEGIAEWVCSKHDEDKEKYSVAMDSVDWDAVEAGQQEAPARIHMHKAKGVWIYVGPPQADGSQW